MNLAANLKSVRNQMEEACRRSGRDLASVTLLPVTKGQPPEIISAAAGLGLDLFGENKVQEAKMKIGRCPGRLRWHMIGHLQSNKCRDAVHFFDMIQSVDSLSIARELNKWAEKSLKTLPVLLEINIAGEASKFGFAPDLCLNELKEINAFPKLEIRGLMTVPPWSSDPEKVRPLFRRLRALKSECENLLGAPLAHLSMGMSGDFETAIEEGATIIRLGTALFGARPKSRVGKAADVDWADGP